MRILSRPPFRPLVSVVIGAALLAGGCSSMGNYVPKLRSLGVYKIDINQGNYLTQEQVDRLRTGQTKQQVRVILGTPLLTDVFHDDRWDYVYEYRRQGVTTEQRKFTVYFQEDKLARWEGDEMPASAIAQNRAAAEKSMAMPAEEESGFVRWIKGVFGRK